MARKKKSLERRHSVKGAISLPQLAKAGSSLRLEIFARNRKIGELFIGRGSLYWYGRNKQRSKRIDWSKFAELMDQLAYAQ